jgi:hypothetical protein
MNGPHQLAELLRDTNTKLEANLAERKLLLKLRRHLSQTINAIERAGSTPSEREMRIPPTSEGEVAR